MPRRIAVLVVLASLTPATAHAAKFTYGVAAGEVTATSAKLWARAPKAGPAVATVRAARGKPVRVTAKATKAHDLTVQALVTGLKPGTKYTFSFAQRRAHSVKGHFVTAPAATSGRTIKFAWSGDADAQRARGETQPFYNSLGDSNFAVYKAMTGEKNDFNVNLGDTIYSDSEVGAESVNGVYRGFDPALTVKQKWAKYRQNLALSNLQKLRDGAALYSHPDDHEWLNDFARDEMLSYTDASGQARTIKGSAVYNAGVKAFSDYAPVGYSKSNGFYRSFRWGKNLEVFFLDERSFRSPSAKTACINPQSGAPDLAPTAPTATRHVFGLVIPSLNQPVSQQCLDTINSPSRTMLGAAQRKKFLAAIQKSKATFKVIMNEVPIQELYAFPYDQWEGYAAERKAVMDIVRKVPGAVFLTTDHHANLVNDVVFNSLYQYSRDDTGVLDIATGPVATMSFKREINGQVGQDPGTGSAAGLIVNAFFKPPPPGGLGMGCTAIDTFSYGEVSVTSNALTVNLKDLNGQPVKDDQTGQPCAPITVPAK